MNIRLYTDGSATTANKPGGYGFVIVVNGKVEEIGSGYLPLATNNDAELEAALQGLERVHTLVHEVFEPLTTYRVTLVSDSQLVLGWASGRYRFKQESKLHKYQQLQSLVERLALNTEWVEGHSGDPHNELCDRLANAARLQINSEIEKKQSKETGNSLIGSKKTGIVCIWYMDQLKVIDLDNNVIENFDREIHGNRGSMFEIRPEKKR